MMILAVCTGPGMAAGGVPPPPGSVLVLTGVDASFPAFCLGILVAGHPRGFQDLQEEAWSPHQGLNLHPRYLPHCQLIGET